MPSQASTSATPPLYSKPGSQHCQGSIRCKGDSAPWAKMMRRFMRSLPPLEQPLSLSSGYRAELASIYHALCPGTDFLKPRYATLRTLYDPEERSQKLDANSLVIFFPSPHTATGEDVLELHVHGGNAVVKAVLGAIPRTVRSKEKPIRYAEPGEFTRRAFYNQRLDLTEVEALGDALSAETEQQRRLAISGASNVPAERYMEWRQKLLYARGELEALIDFSEDQQFDETPEILFKSVVEQTSQLKRLLDTSVKNAFRGELLRNGLNIALVGAPNAGKSSLLNRIVKREAAIVSGEAGTTRDVIDVGVDIGGYYCKFGDLAGLRSTQSDEGSPGIGDIELEGMRRAKQRALHADVVIIVLSIEPQAMGSKSLHGIQINPEVSETLRRIDATRQEILYVVNKADLIVEEKERKSILNELKCLLDTKSYPVSPQPCLMVSCISQMTPASETSDSDGIRALLHTLIKTFESKTSVVVPQDAASKRLSVGRDMWAESLGASERHRLLLQQCVSHLESFLEGASNTLSEPSLGSQEAETDVVVAAEELRHAADCLARITGKGEAGGVEEVLGVVFEK
ncbi:MAG: hypothetical protein Q9191_004959 [Dirinaria sp. TL-2023a]